MASPIPSPTPAIVRAKPAPQQALAIALILLEGFNKHYALFRECARAAKRYFEAGKATPEKPKRAAPWRPHQAIRMHSTRALCSRGEAAASPMLRS